MTDDRYDAGDEKHVSRKRARADRDKVIRNRVIRAFMSNEEGRRYIWLELSSLNVFAQYEGLVENHAGLAFAEGKRSVGVRLLNDVSRLAPEDYIKMLRENTNLKDEEDGGRDPADT